MDTFLTKQQEALHVFKERYGVGISQELATGAGSGGKQLGPSGLAPDLVLQHIQAGTSAQGKGVRELREENGQGVAMQKGKEGEKPRSNLAQGEGSEGGLTLTGEQGPMSKLAQGEGGAGVSSPTRQQGSILKPGVAHKENKEGVLRKTGDKDPNTWGKLALQVITVKQGPPPPPLLLNKNYNHFSEGELMEVDEGAQPQKCKRGGEKTVGEMKTSGRETTMRRRMTRWWR